MIRISGGRAVVVLTRSLYSRESLAAAALVVGERAAVFLSRTRSDFEATLVPSRPASRRRLRALAGEFLNEALSHGYRAEVAAFHRALSAPVMARLLAEGFPETRTDPLEEMEPQVKADRREETERLLDAARLQR